LEWWRIALKTNILLQQHSNIPKAILWDSLLVPGFFWTLTVTATSNNYFFSS
jgi:hypothetical protein